MGSQQDYQYRLTGITQKILDGQSSKQSLQSALDDFAFMCSDITGVKPDATFDAWADDSFLASGVAINPQAAAYCIKDYQRSVMFIRGVNAAIDGAIKNNPAARLTILYAGCGPFATLLLPLILNYKPEQLDIHLLDIHQASLGSIGQLVSALNLDEYQINLIQGDACTYQHDSCLDIIIAEVMQKALEQEPQVAATANLAPQLCKTGVFIPQKIDVQLCLAHWENEKQHVANRGRLDTQALVATGRRYPLGMQLSLTPSMAREWVSNRVFNAQTAMHEIPLGDIQLPDIDDIERFDVLMLTHIQVFENNGLSDYEADITLPHKCYEFNALRAGASYRACYQLGAYPKFSFTENIPKSR